MSAFQYIEATALLHSLKMSDVPALATLITAILSIVYITINYNTEIQKKLRADRKYLADYEAEVENQQKRAEFQAKLSQENRENLDREARYLQETKLEHVNTVCKTMSESLISFLESQNEMKVDLNKQMNEIRETQVQQQVGIDMINQEIEMIYQSASLSDISLRIDLDDTKTDFIGKLDKTVRNFGQCNEIIQQQIQQISIDFTEELNFAKNKVEPASSQHMLG